jgi:translation initiation factor 2B subunit (eIF-2B alpha/beta/delta family)
MTRATREGPGGADPAGAARGFLDRLERWVATERSTSAAGLRAALLAHLRAAQAEQPESALVHQLGARALEVAEAGVARGDPPVELRDHLARSCAAEREDLDASEDAAAREATLLLDRREAWIAVVGNGALTRRALLETRRAGRAPRVLVAEARPGLDGRVLAAAVAAERIPVWLVVDAALPLLLSQAAAVWLEAEAVTDQGAVCRIGAYAAALAAREHSVPVWLLATRRRFLPATTGALRLVERPPAAVWEAPPEGVRPRNVHHELVPLALTRGVVVEDAVLGPTESATLARERPLPEALAGATS